MDYSAHLTQLDQHGAALAAAAERAGAEAAVPTCPGWDVRALLDHVSMVHRWATATVLGERGAGLEHPADGDDIVAWFRDGHAAVVETLRATPPDQPAWAFLAGASKTVAFWARRQAHETAIHRADAEFAATTIPSYDSDFALDGIGELLEGFMARPGGTLYSDPPFTLRVAPSDADVSWLVTVGPSEREIARDGVGDAGCTISGASADLYLHLWNRTPATPVVVDGDESVARRWSELAQVTWS